MPNENDTVKKLNNLIALDIDAVNAYEAAIKRIDVISIQERLREFQQDHRRHVQNLSEFVIRLGGSPRQKPDVKGFIIKGFTAATSAMGNEAALKAMQGNEELTNRTYKSALDEQWPADIRTIIERNFADEQRHLAYVKECLRIRTWEQAAHV
jgi:uncharacterized protein (TIGR02284 family)